MTDPSVIAFAVPEGGGPVLEQARRQGHHLGGTGSIGCRRLGFTAAGFGRLGGSSGIGRLGGERVGLVDHVVGRS
ncbi:MAG: hypothetical protein OES57_05900 [Acidimicrobiia bacterium]|nr:hypothetical protein [Acidimicrobiia bacterium]